MAPDLDPISDVIRQGIIESSPLKVYDQGTQEMLTLATTTAAAFKVVNPAGFVRTLPVKKLTALGHFAIACKCYNLEVACGDAQISAYIGFLHANFYSASNLDSHWYAIKNLGKQIGYYIPPAQECMYKLAKCNCRLIKDNKVPVTVPLLNQLCHAANVLFDD